MTIQETSAFMKRIKQHYQEFVIDEYKAREWYKELKDYDYEEVNQKLDEHLKSETYGNTIPKVYFLTKYLRKIEDKNKNFMEDTKFRCSKCGAILQFKYHDSHTARHNSIDYIKRREKYIGKEFDEQAMMELPEASFETFYTKFIEQLMDVIPDKDEKERLTKLVEMIYGVYEG